MKKILSIEGSTSPSECSLLYNLASQVSTGCIVEIGTHQGRATAALAQGSIDNNKIPIYTIDPHDNFEGVLGGKYGPMDKIAFFKNVLRVGIGEVVHLINLVAEDVAKGWKKDISLLFIDGDHRYSVVKQDFLLWEPFVVRGGLIVFHDSRDPKIGPAKVIRESTSLNKYSVINIFDTITVLKKHKNY